MNLMFNRLLDEIMEVERALRDKDKPRVVTGAVAWLDYLDSLQYVRIIFIRRWDGEVRWYYATDILSMRIVSDVNDDSHCFFPIFMHIELKVRSDAIAHSVEK